MVQVLIILAFFAARARDILHEGQGEAGDAAGTPPSVHPWWGPPLPFLTLVVVWLGFHLFTIRAGRTMDRTGSLLSFRRTHTLMTTARVMVLSALVASTLWLGWDQRVRSVLGDTILLDELVIVSPLLLILVLTWWSVEPLERRLRDAILMRELMESRPVHPWPSKAVWVWSQVRHQMLLILLPICLVIGWGEAVEAVPRWLGSALPQRWDVWSEVMQWGGILAVLALTPLLLRHLWSIVPLGSGLLRDEIVAVCRQYRIRVWGGGPLVWRTHGMVVNAAILGMFYPFRFLLLTDAMLERLTREQLEVVLAHEIAHVRRRHMIWMGLAVFGTVMCCVLGAGLAAQLVPVPSVIASIMEIGGGLASLVLGVGVFGVVSRRFEWDADAFALCHMTRLEAAAAGVADDPLTVTPAAAATTVETLQAVADLNAMPTGQFSFRHGSIETRQRRVRALVGRPVNALPIQRQVMWIRIGAALLAAAAAVPVILSVAMQEVV